MIDRVEGFFQVVEIPFGKALPRFQADAIDLRFELFNFFYPFFGQADLEAPPVLRMDIPRHQLFIAKQIYDPGYRGIIFVKYPCDFILLQLSLFIKVLHDEPLVNRDIKAQLLKTALGVLLHLPCRPVQ